MNKQILKKLSALLVAVAVTTPVIGVMQDTILADILSETGDKTAQAQYGGSNADVITNTATVDSQTFDDNTANNTASASDLFCYAPDIEVTSFTDTVTSIQASAAQTYTAVITNNGTSRIEQIDYDFAINTGEFLNDGSMTVTVSTGSTSQVTSSTSGNVTTYSYEITGIDLQPTETVSVTISGLTVEPTAVDGTVYNATIDILPAQPTFDDCAITDPDLANNFGSDDTAMQRVADLSLVKISSGGADSSTSTTGRLDAGESMSYTLTVTNNGPSEAEENIVVTDTWPSQITPVLPAVPSPAGNYTESANWDCQYSAPTMTCTNTNPLANAGTSSIVINGTVNQTY